MDQVRPFGRAAHGLVPDLAGLCGRCGDGKAAVGPDGQVSPCPMSTTLGVGNVHTADLAEILAGAAMADLPGRALAGRDPGVDRAGLRDRARPPCPPQCAHIG
ncbi:SPASM domain-containing protein [Spirillospora sp. CA-128828]|uniref:SPASM domain-containing protein n=1 Tax=Spirillospora sp. CA-128828 TaxID=3240033 RepID=UPI003D8A7720